MRIRKETSEVIFKNSAFKGRSYLRRLRVKYREGFVDLRETNREISIHNLYSFRNMIS
jgi:hypothetical protein